MTKPKILIVDDDEVLSLALSLGLKKKNFCTQVLTDGLQCLDFLTKENFDLVLLDIMFPNISGENVLLNIRKHFSPIELPVIMVTSKEEPKDIIACLSKGANDYLIKPVHLDIASARINTQLELLKLNKDNIRKSELEAIKAMVVTYNHEINNPLAIALGHLEEFQIDPKPDTLERVHGALLRIGDITQKIREVTKEEDISFAHYSKGTKMIKVR